jgi:integrase
MEKPDEIVATAEGALSTDVVDLTVDVERAAALAQNAKAANTLRAYRAAWTVFARWCETKQLHPGGPIDDHPVAVDAQTLWLYITALAEGRVPGPRRKGKPGPQPDKARRPNTIEGHLAAIAYVHHQLGLTAPTNHPRILDQMAAVHRTYAGSGVNKKEPVLANMLPDLVAAIPAAPAGASPRRQAVPVRNKAILLLGFGGAFRREEMTDRIVWGDIVEEDEGLVVHLRTSKKDPTGKGMYKRIPRGRPETCAALALRAWKAVAASICSVADDSPVFVSLSYNHLGRALNSGSVALIVKKIVLAAGYDPAGYAGHSLRSGFVTSADEAGATTFEIMDVTGHEDANMIKAYRHKSKAAWKRNAGRGLM